MKRLFDIAVSLISMIVLAPILVPVMIILRFTGEGKILYLQERVGRNNKRFFITKFATMLENSPNIGSGEHTLQNDPRVLPFGKFLRKSKINELPQIWDILIGKMSWVGPRPTTPSHHSLYPEYYYDVMKGHVPGLTGVGSIVFRDEESILTRSDDFHITYSQEIVPYKAELELWYKKNHNFGMDVILIFLTAWVVIKPESRLLFKLYPTVPYIDLDKIGENKSL